MKPTALSDADARRRAATEFDRNFVVEAGAGTGKTSLLVERLLVATGAGLAGATEFAAITFTEKAAGEMRDRLAEGLTRLRRAALGQEPNDPTKPWSRALDHLVRDRGIAPADVSARALATLTELDRAQVTTIHSFCADLLRTYPFEAGVDPGFAVDRGPLFEDLLDDEWERFLGEELGPRATRADLWRRLVPRIRLPALRALSRGLAAFSIPPALLAGTGRPPDASSLFGGEAAGLAAAIGSVLVRQKGMSSGAVEKLDLYRRALDTFASEGHKALVALLTRPDEAKTLGKTPPTSKRKLGDVEPGEMEAVAKDARDLLLAVASVDDEAFRDLVLASAPFALRARDLLLERGAVNFDGLLTLARDVLRDHPAVREEVRRRYRMLLVDEFQDTDPLQYEIVLFLGGAKAERESDPFEVPLEPGRLFIVGDPKQSIYRFRGADYEAFLRAVERILAQDGETLDLVANFRSVGAVIAPVNDLFRKRWIESKPYQPEYKAIEAARPDGDEGPRVEILTVAATPNADARREAEGAAVASRIAALVQGEGRRYGDVMLLLRAFTPLPFYLRPLRQAGIPFVVDGGKLFLERTEVAQLMAALRALARPSDPAALLAFLRSPAGGAPDSELLAYGTSGGPWRFSATPDPAAFPAVAGALRLLRGLAGETKGIPAEATVRRVLERTGLLPLGAFAYEGAQRVANLRKLAAAAAELARDGTLSLNEVLDALESERAADVEGDSPLADEKADAVRVLTIHKAKGLEADVVIVADLAREEKHGKSAAEDVGKVKLDKRVDSLALKGAGLKNAARIRFEREETRHDEAEGLRAFYVALTRARERLILFAAASKARAPWVEALAPWGYSPSSPPGDGERIHGGLVLHVAATPQAAPRLPEAGLEGESTAVAAWLDATGRLRDRAKPPIRSASGAREERAARSAEAEAGSAVDAPDRDVALATGTAVHAALERWDPASKAPITAALADLSRRAAEEHGVAPAEVEREARTVLAAFLASPLPARLRTIDVLGREVPMLLHEDDGTTVTGVLDLLYRDAEGTLVVADYKTDHGLTPRDASERYGPQLADYAEAVRRAMRLAAPPRTELWLLRDGKILPLPTGPR
ncbi:MAG: UvrD-helicase domain-containing protein [Acidobacteriia bacterium]|nr:UvrD-helicase domain-containing protein [Terriglobia bacterium]